MTNDITSELAKLHELTGVEFSRQVERIAKRKEFHPLETDKDIFTMIMRICYRPQEKLWNSDIGCIFSPIRRRYEHQILS